MKRYIKAKTRKWYSSITGEFKARPIRSMLFFILSAIIIAYTSQALYSYFNAFAMLGYLFACLIGFSDIIKKPHRTLVWGLGFAISAIAFGFIISAVLEGLQKKAIGLSISGLVMLSIMIFLFWQSRKLKRY